jgi:hypothetical protein
MGTGSCDMTDDSRWLIPRSVMRCDAAFRECYWGDKTNADETVARNPAITTKIFILEPETNTRLG